MTLLRIGIERYQPGDATGYVKTIARAGHSVEQIMQYPIYSGALAGVGRWVSLALTLSAAYSCVAKKPSAGTVPVSFCALGAMRRVKAQLFSPATLASPQLHLLSGSATMLGIFALDGSGYRLHDQPWTFNFRRAGWVLVWLIRSFGGYPDGVAFNCPVGEYHGSS